MKYFFKLTLVLSCSGAAVFAANAPKGRKPNNNPTSSYALTPEEAALVEAARGEFEKKGPAPSKRLQDRMQDQVASVEEMDRMKRILKLQRQIEVLNYEQIQSVEDFVQKIQAVKKQNGK